MDRKKIILLFIITITFCSMANAQYQNHLILKKGIRNKLHFLVGDSIRFVRQGFEWPVEGPITAIGEDFIVVKQDTYSLSEIKTLVYVRKSFGFKAGGKVLRIAGPAFIAMATFNALIRSIRPILTVRNIITGGSLFTAGLILPIFQIRKYPLGEKFFLRIVPSDPELMRLRND